LSHVVLCLQLIRKFSHFPQNLPIIIKCKAATAVMGCMAVYLKEEDVQHRMSILFSQLLMELSDANQTGKCQ
jgi:hypothetical protein